MHTISFGISCGGLRMILYLQRKTCKNEISCRSRLVSAVVTTLRMQYMHSGALRWLKAFGGSWNNVERSCGRNSNASVICSKVSLHKTIMAELFAYIGWSIWHNRNARKFGTVTMPMEMIYTDAVQRLQEFHSAQDPPLYKKTKS